MSRHPRALSIGGVREVGGVRCPRGRPCSSKLAPAAVGPPSSRPSAFAYMQQFYTSTRSRAAAPDPHMEHGYSQMCERTCEGRCMRAPLRILGQGQGSGQELSCCVPEKDLLAFALKAQFTAHAAPFTSPAPHRIHPSQPHHTSAAQPDRPAPSHTSRLERAATATLVQPRATKEAPATARPNNMNNLQVSDQPVIPMRGLRAGCTGGTLCST